MTIKGTGGWHPRASTAVLALVLGVAGMTGCAGKSGGADVASAGGKAKASAPADDGAAPAADTEERMRQFTRCMREQGVDMPDPEPGGRPLIKFTGGPQQREKFEKAREACRKYLPAGEDLAKDPELRESLRQYAKCMREHGVDMPDPAPDAKGLQIDKRKMQDPTYQKAHEACADKIKRPRATRTGGAK